MTTWAIKLTDTELCANLDRLIEAFERAPFECWKDINADIQDLRTEFEKRGLAHDYFG